MDKFDFPIKKDNLRIILIGLVVNVVGFLLMIGGGSENPEQFNANELFSSVRITVAPFLAVIGYIIIIFGILKKPTNK